MNIFVFLFIQLSKEMVFQIGVEYFIERVCWFFFFFFKWNSSWNIYGA